MLPRKKNMMLTPMAFFSGVPSSIISPFRRLIKHSAPREEGCGCVPLWRSICWAANAGWPRKSIFLSEHMPWTVLTEVLKWESKYASFHDRRCVLSFPRKHDSITPVKGSLKQHRIRLGISQALILVWGLFCWLAWWCVRCRDKSMIKRCSCAGGNSWRDSCLKAKLKVICSLCVAFPSLDRFEKELGAWWLSFPPRDFSSGVAKKYAI